MQGVWSNIHFRGHWAAVLPAQGMPPHGVESFTKFSPQVKYLALQDPAQMSPSNVLSLSPELQVSSSSLQLS